MTKKRLSIVFFILIIVSAAGLLLKFSKIETPKQHVNNAKKVTQLASNKEADKVPASLPSKDKSDNNSSNAADSKTPSSSTGTVNSSSTQGSPAAEKVDENINKDSEPSVNTDSGDKSTQGVDPKSQDYNQLVNEANKHKDSNKKDKYQTDPIPAGMPTPVEPQDVKINKSTAEYCTLSIRCDTILKNKNKLKKSKYSVLPDDGVIYAQKQVVFFKGESVFDVLNRETAENNIQMDFVNTPIYNSAYIRGIHNLYEFDCGNLSGWMYKVNGWFPNYGCSRYQVKPGDKIEWEYTCDLGRDVGCVWMGNKK